MKRLLTRRRVLLALAAVALLAGGMWWYFSPRLTEVEKQFVGKWSMPNVVISLRQSPVPTGGKQVYEFLPNRVVRIARFLPDGTQVGKTLVGRWSIENGELVVDPLFPDESKGLSRLIERRPDDRNRNVIRGVEPDRLILDYDTKTQEVFHIADPLTLTRDPDAPTPTGDVMTLRDLGR